MNVIVIIVVVVISCLVLWGIEYIFGLIFKSKPPKDSIEHLRKLSEDIAPRKFRKQRK